MKIDRKLLTLVLAFGMVLSGCGKQIEESKKKKKTAKNEVTTEEPSTTTYGIEHTDVPTTTTEEPVVAIPFTRLSKEAEQNGAYAEVVQEMIADFKEELPEQVSNIQTYHVYRRYGFAALSEDGINAFVQETYSDDYNINVSEISIENVYLYSGAPYIPLDENSEMPSGIVLVMRVELNIYGNIVESGDTIEGSFASYVRVSNFDLTVDDTLTKVIGHGKTDCDFSFISETCERIIFDSVDSQQNKDMTKVYEFNSATINNKLSGYLFEYHKAFWGEMYSVYRCGVTLEAIERDSGIVWTITCVEAQPDETAWTLPDDC